MNSLVMLSLGSYVFGISTAAYDDLQRTSEFRWASQDRIGAAPALQWIGRGSDTISLSGKVYPSFYAGSKGLEQVARMREAASAGKPLLMVDGSGRMWGLYCITSIREGQTTFFSDGRPRCIDFSIELSAYGGALTSPIGETALV